MRVKKHTQI